MYNSELWTLTKKLENEIDVFQRNLLKKILQIKYPYIIRNEDLYRKTCEIPWSTKIKTRRLRWTGHFLRLADKTPAKLAYKESNRKVGRNFCGNTLTWRKQINRDLYYVNTNLFLDLVNISYLAEDRDWWNKEVVKPTCCGAQHERRNSQ